jgi:hypothetical protein
MSHYTSRRNFLKSVLGSAAALSLSGCKGTLPSHIFGSSKEKPNIIFVLADDLGYGDLG